MYLRPFIGGVGRLLTITQHFNFCTAAWEISLSSMSSTNGESSGLILLTEYFFALESARRVTTKIGEVGIYLLHNAHIY